MRRVAGPLSWVFVIAGLLLCYVGFKDWFWSLQGQEEAREAWVEVSPRDTDVPYSRHDEPRAENSRRRDSALARLYVPRLDKEAFVLDNATARNLKRGPARLAVTSLPGAPGNCVIAGHRDTHFRFLKDIRKGDDIELHYGGRSYRYRVTSLNVVKPSNTDLLRPVRKPVLTLVTCYPFTYLGRAPDRFIVRAEMADDLYSKQQSH